MPHNMPLHVTGGTVFRPPVEVHSISVDEEVGLYIANAKLPNMNRNAFQVEQATLQAAQGADAQAVDR